MAVITLKRPSRPSKRRGKRTARTDRRAGDLRIALALGGEKTLLVPCKIELSCSGELHWTTTSASFCSCSFLNSLTEATLDLFEARAA